MLSRPVDWFGRRWPPASQKRDADCDEERKPATRRPGRWSAAARLRARIRGRLMARNGVPPVSLGSSQSTLGTETCPVAEAGRHRRLGKARGGRSFCDESWLPRVVEPCSEDGPNAGAGRVGHRSRPPGPERVLPVAEDADPEATGLTSSAGQGRVVRCVGAAGHRTWGVPEYVVDGCCASDRCQR